MIVGILVLGTSPPGPSGSAVLVAAASTFDPATLAVGTVLILLGLMGKSAQFPLHTWLPDAMAGPTPISALIHAATMVAAGVYLVDGCTPSTSASPTALGVLAVSACHHDARRRGSSRSPEDDLKRVLPRSTVGQLAYMMGALAVGVPRRRDVPPPDPCGLQGAAVPGIRGGAARHRHGRDGPPSAACATGCRAPRR